MARADEQTNVRLPADLKAYVQDQAEAARRSLTAEVIHRLERTREQDQQATQQPMPHAGVTKDNP